MNKLVVWKYPVPVKDTFALTMPQSSRILAVQMQNGVPQIWALVNPSLPDTEDRKFILVGTGHSHSANDLGRQRYIGTFQTEVLGLVFHLFEV